MEFLKADQTFTSESVLFYCTFESKFFILAPIMAEFSLHTNRHKDKSVACTNLPRIPSIKARSKRLCPFINDGLKDTA